MSPPAEQKNAQKEVEDILSELDATLEKIDSLSEDDIAGLLNATGASCEDFISAVEAASAEEQHALLEAVRQFASRNRGSIAIVKGLAESTSWADLGPAIIYHLVKMPAKADTEAGEIEKLKAFFHAIPGPVHLRPFEIKEIGELKKSRKALANSREQAEEAISAEDEEPEPSY